MCPFQNKMNTFHWNVVPGMGYIIYIPTYYVIKAYKYSGLVEAIHDHNRKGLKPPRIQKGSLILPKDLVTSPEVNSFKYIM